MVTFRNWNNERLSIANGSFANISMSIVSGYVAMYLLDSLHATDAEMGLLNSLPSLVNLFSMLAAAIAIGRFRSKKLFCVTATTVSRSFYIWIALIPFLSLPHAAMWVVWLVALTRVPQSFGDLSWQALIGDIVPAERRSGFFSERNRALTVVGLMATFATGYFLQQFDKSWSWPYQLAFLSTGIFASLEIWLLLLHREPNVSAPSVPLLVKGFHGMGSSVVSRIARDKRFMVVVAALLFFNFAWQMSWPLFNIYQIRVAHAPALWLGMFTVAGQLTQILSYRWWGRMAERFGNAKMMAWAAIGMSLAPVLTVASTNVYYLTAINLITGIPVAGTTLLLFNYLLEFSPCSQRTAYIAFYNVLLAIVGFIAPEVGIWLLMQIHMVGDMAMSSALRFLAGLLFLGISGWVAKPPLSPSNGLAVDA